MNKSSNGNFFKRFFTKKSVPAIESQVDSNDKAPSNIQDRTPKEQKYIDEVRRSGAKTKA